MPLDDATRIALTSARLVYNAPLSQQRATALLAALDVDAGASVLDLGCGRGELLLRAVATLDGRGTGVDSDPSALDAAREKAAARGLTDRVRFIEGDAGDWRERADVVLCVASSHAVGGTTALMAALRRLVRAGGRAVVGDGIFTTTPDAAARGQFGDLPDLAGLAELAVTEGLRPLHVSASTPQEWDDFESGWRAGLELSADPDARALADERRTAYLSGYRGVLGFGWLVLAPAP